MNLCWLLTLQVMSVPDFMMFQESVVAGSFFERDFLVGLVFNSHSRYIYKVLNNIDVFICLCCPIDAKGRT